MWDMGILLVGVWVWGGGEVSFWQLILYWSLRRIGGYREALEFMPPLLIIDK